MGGGPQHPSAASFHSFILSPSSFFAEAATQKGQEAEAESSPQQTAGAEPAAAEKEVASATEARRGRRRRTGGGRHPDPINKTELERKGKKKDTFWQSWKGEGLDEDREIGKRRRRRRRGGGRTWGRGESISDAACSHRLLMPLP